MTIYAIDGITPELPPEGTYYIAPTAVLIGRVKLLPGASVWFGAVLRGDNDWIVVGENSNVQDNTVIHTDVGQPAVLGAGVTVGHATIIHSATIGDGSLIGMGATLLNGVRIGVNSVVGAGSLAPEGKVYGDNSLILGSPARHMRSLTEEQRARAAHAANVYVANAARYRDGLKLIR